MNDKDVDRLNVALRTRYEIEREIGKGGMATVYLAEDVRHHRKVAIKVLKPELAAIIGGEQFLAEIETMAKLQHPHILPLFNREASRTASTARGTFAGAGGPSGPRASPSRREGSRSSRRECEGSRMQ
jgi:hypothetical protein